MSKPLGIAAHDHIIVRKREWGVLSFNIVGQSGNGSSALRADGRAPNDAKTGRIPMLRQLAFASIIVLTSSLASAQTAKFQVEETTIEDIQAAILRGELTSTRLVRLYLERVKAYNGTCVNQPDGILGQAPITPIKHAHALNALMTLNLRPATREKLGFDARKARSMTDAVDADPSMPDALEAAAQQD